MTREFPPHDRRTEFLVLLLFCCVMTALQAARGILISPGDPEYSEPIDHHKYLYMATQNPFGFHIADACRRVAVPFVAGLHAGSIVWPRACFQISAPVAVLIAYSNPSHEPT